MTTVRLLLLTVYLAVASVPLAIDAAPPKFESFTVNPRGQENLKFTFSKAAATSNDPIVISVVGRKFTKEDRTHRTDLQKVWLKENVPVEYAFVTRSLDDCGLKRKGEIAMCDHYRFKDKNTEREFSYFIYVGNWP